MNKKSRKIKIKPISDNYMAMWIKELNSKKQGKVQSEQSTNQSEVSKNQFKIPQIPLKRKINNNVTIDKRKKQ